MEEATVETVPDQVETAWEEPTTLEYIQVLPQNTAHLIQFVQFVKSWLSSTNVGSSSARLYLE